MLFLSVLNDSMRNLFTFSWAAFSTCVDDRSGEKTSLKVRVLVEEEAGRGGG